LSRLARRLRPGFTTGAAAAAAARAALHLLIGGRLPTRVRLPLLSGETIEIAVHAGGRQAESCAWATVIKDGGDDPDVTNGAEIGAIVALAPGGGQIDIRGGTGVGRITLPGLELPPGEPAINPGPRRMIRQAVEALLGWRAATRHNVVVEVFVPEGERLAARTLNARLGILGGISILGTTGRVQPLSHAAWQATIDAALSVARAAELTEVLLTTGRRSERFAQQRFARHPPQAFIQMGDHVAHALGSAARLGFTRCVLALFFGKAVKIAQGAGQTHAARSRLEIGWLAQLAREHCPDAALVQAIAEANTARHVLELVRGVCPQLVTAVGQHLLHSAALFAGPALAVGAVLFDFEGRVLFSAPGGAK
jgi:cobalt-precorrin-5B (C1)-methyltransferase